MQLELSFLSIIDTLAIATTFMLGLLFLTIGSNNRKANVFLGLFLWSLTIEIFGSLSQSISQDLYLIPHTTLFTIPLLLLYVNQTINNPYKKEYSLLFVLGVFFNIISFFNIDMEPVMFLEYIFNVSILLYIFKIVQQHKRRVSNFYSDLEQKTLSWIKAIIFVFLGFHLLWIIEDIIGFTNENVIEYFVATSTILTFFMVYWIGYNGFSQQEIFKEKVFNYNNPSTTKVAFHNFEEDLFLFKTLKETIANKKLYTNSNLNLRLLSEALQVKEKELSRLINTHSKTNFYQFINEFRISEFKDLIQSPKAEQLSILGLAEEAGFSSKSTFYTTFKALEGMTPKQYELSLK